MQKIFNIGSIRRENFKKHLVQKLQIMKSDVLLFRELVKKLQFLSQQEVKLEDLQSVEKIFLNLILHIQIQLSIFMFKAKNFGQQENTH